MAESLLNERGRCWRLALSITVFVVAAAWMTAPPADANFTTTKCNGSNIIGRGATFANAAHQGLIAGFAGTYCPGGPTVVYEATGSGSGRRVMGERTSGSPEGNNTTGVLSRNQVPRFGMTDEPPQPLGQGQMEEGTDPAGNGDEGEMNVVPVASGAVPMTVNFPNNCDRSLLPDASETDPASANSAPFVDRVRFTRTQFEAIWAGDNTADNWTEVFPSLAADADCNVSITRVVRFDNSGTTFTFKDYLDHINSGRGWLTTYNSSPDTRNWPDPGSGIGDRDDCGNNNGIPEPSDPDGPIGNQLTSACSNGNGPLAVKLLSVDGGVGYGDIATIRSNGYAIAPSPPAGSRDDDVFWTQAANPSNTFREATDDPNGFRTDGAKGADCDPVTFNNQPATTVGDWSNTTGVDSAAGFVICTLTYGLLFTDYEPPYSLQGGGFAVEEQKARTVKDYWTYALSDAGQGTLPGNDYDRLPLDIQEKARLGITSVCYDIAGTGPCPGPTDYPRPGSGTPLRVPLMIAYNECTVPNSAHVPPIGSPSCTPPVRSSTQLTAGTGGLGGPFARYGVVAGNPVTGADEADVSVSAFINDVRRVSNGLDYTGRVVLTSQIRITDKRNDDLGTISGTVRDTELSLPIQCVDNGAAGGGTCSLTTTVDTLVPNFSREGKRAILSMLEVKVEDAGPNGTLGAGCPHICGDGDEGVYLNQGIFTP